jgi:phosphatidylglycerol:prolipoprotein diacylglycerol transferase
MIEAAIQFPNIDPAALTLPSFDLFGNTWGPFHLRWYALAYIVGLVLGWRWMVWLIRRDRLWTPGKPALNVPQADDFLFWATLGVILGGRLGYVLFYMLPSATERAKLAADLFAVFRIWEGGMSFHGGFIGVLLAAVYFTYNVHVNFAPRFSVSATPRKHVNEEQFAALAKKRAVAQPSPDKRQDYVRVGEIGWLKKKDAEDAREKARTDTIDLLRLGDIAAAATPIGLFFGRIANFINGELWGRPTDAPWGVVFCNETLVRMNGSCTAGTAPRHPSQLYEAALEGLVLFAVINILTLRFDSLRRPGLNIGVFLVCYGLFRLLLEFVREPDQQMPDFLRGYVTMGMLLCIPMIIAGAWLIRRALQTPRLATA